MHQVPDWAEVRRLRRDEKSIKRIADELGMSRTTVYRPLSLRDPPRYVRESRASLLEPFREQIAALPDEDEHAPATMILESLREKGSGDILQLDW